MLTVLFNVLAPVLICTCIGFFWARSNAPYNAEFVTRVVLNVGAPCLIVSSITNVDVSLSSVLQIAGVAVLVTIGLTIVGLILIFLKSGDWRTLLPPVIFANTGNMGLPLCLFAFGETGLALGVAYFVILTLAHMVLGTFIVSRSEGSTQSKLFATFKQPLVIAAILGMLMLVIGAHLPVWLKNTVDLLAGMTIPLMLITLGVSLYSMKSVAWVEGFYYSLVKVGGGLALGWLVASMLSLEGVVRNVAILQAMMPAAVFNYLFALRYDRQPEIVAGVVVVSTVMSLLLLPIALTFLIN